MRQPRHNLILDGFADQKEHSRAAGFDGAPERLDPTFPIWLSFNEDKGRKRGLQSNLWSWFVLDAACRLRRAAGAEALPDIFDTN